MTSPLDAFPKSAAKSGGLSSLRKAMKKIIAPKTAKVSVVDMKRAMRAVEAMGKQVGTVTVHVDGSFAISARVPGSTEVTVTEWDEVLPNGKA